MSKTIFSNPLITGLKFGIELEIEAPGLYEDDEVYNENAEVYESVIPDIPQGWIKEIEESIQGVELVSEIPATFDTVMADIDRLFEDIFNQGFIPIRTPRGSTHVHVNVSDLTWEQMKSFTMACAWAEPALIELAGKGRKGNLFAHSYETCPIGWEGIIRSLQRKEISFYNDSHYMATSFYPMQTLGSVEFRMGPSSRNAKEAITWVNLINIVAKAGRESTFNGNEVPAFLLSLLQYIKNDNNKHSIIIAKARKQAQEIWCAMNRKAQPLPKSKYQFMTSPEYGQEIAPQIQQVAQISPAAAMQLSHDWFNQLYPSNPIEAVEEIPMDEMYFSNPNLPMEF